MRAHTIVVLLLCVTIACATPKTTSAQTATLYDNFNEQFLSPAKWNTFGACFTTNGQELECVREIQHGKLRLAHRSFGQNDSDAGAQFGEVNVRFTNPALIKGISTDLVIQDVEEASCVANPTSFATAAHFDGNFFNTGSGDPSDDIGAHIVFGRTFSDPPGQISIFSQLSRGFSFGIDFTLLGTVSIGTPITATLTWDQSSHQFIASWTNRITHKRTQATLPYNFSDTDAATNAYKEIGVNTTPANCTATPAWAYMETDFDNVYIQ
jgi:hypothetical protein